VVTPLPVSVHVVCMPFRHAHANLAALHNANLPPSLAQYTYSAAVVNATNFSEPYMYMSINKVPHSNDSNSVFTFFRFLYSESIPPCSLLWTSFRATLTHR
jgi:hypothetical protein